MSSYIYSLYDLINIRDGRVGIGTETPTESFHVHNGSIYVERMTNVASNIDVAYSTLSNMKTLRVDNITSQSSSKINMSAMLLSNVDTLSVNVITSDSNIIGFNNKTLSNIAFANVTNDVVVGRTLFTSNIQVLGDFTTLNTVTSNTEQMTVTNAGSGPALLVRQTGVESVAAFYDDNAIAMYIGGGTTDAGFVGIGTAVADSRLHMYDTASIFNHIHTGSTNAAQVKFTNNGGDTFVGPSAAGFIDFLSTSTQPMRIGTSNAEYIRVATNGNVGIGSTSPAFPLDVANTTRIKDALYLNTNNMNTIFYSFGGQTFSSGSKFIGMTLAWANATTNNKLAFRVKVKAHLAGDDSVAYRKFESIITPANDSANGKPKQIVATEIADTNNNDFSALTHTVTRVGNSSVDLKVSWSTTVSSYIGNIQVEIFANTSLGNFTFTPIYN